MSQTQIQQSEKSAYQQAYEQHDALRGNSAGEGLTTRRAQRTRRLERRDAYNRMMDERAREGAALSAEYGELIEKDDYDSVRSGLKLSKLDEAKSEDFWKEEEQAREFLTELGDAIDAKEIGTSIDDEAKEALKEIKERFARLKESFTPGMLRMRGREGDLRDSSAFRRGQAQSLRELRSELSAKNGPKKGSFGEAAKALNIDEGKAGKAQIDTEADVGRMKQISDEGQKVKDEDWEKGREEEEGAQTAFGTLFAEKMRAALAKDMMDANGNPWKAPSPPITGGAGLKKEDFSTAFSDTAQKEAPDTHEAFSSREEVMQAYARLKEIGETMRPARDGNLYAPMPYVGKDDAQEVTRGFAGFAAAAARQLIGDGRDTYEAAAYFHRVAHSAAIAAIAAERAKNMLDIKEKIGNDTLKIVFENKSMDEYLKRFVDEPFYKGAGKMLNAEWELGTSTGGIPAARAEMASLTGGTSAVGTGLMAISEQVKSLVSGAGGGKKQLPADLPIYYDALLFALARAGKPQPKDKTEALVMILDTARGMDEDASGSAQGDEMRDAVVSAQRMSYRRSEIIGRTEYAHRGAEGDKIAEWINKISGADASKLNVQSFEQFLTDIKAPVVKNEFLRAFIELLANPASINFEDKKYSGADTQATLDTANAAASGEPSGETVAKAIRTLLGARKAASGGGAIEEEREGLYNRVLFNRAHALARARGEARFTREGDAAQSEKERRAAIAGPGGASVQDTRALVWQSKAGKVKEEGTGGAEIKARRESVEGTAIKGVDDIYSMLPKLDVAIGKFNNPPLPAAANADEIKDAADTAFNAVVLAMENLMTESKKPDAPKTLAPALSKISRIEPVEYIKNAGAKRNTDFASWPGIAVVLSNVRRHLAHAPVRMMNASAQSGGAATDAYEALYFKILDKTEGPQNDYLVATILYLSCVTDKTNADALNLARAVFALGPLEFKLLIYALLNRDKTEGDELAAVTFEQFRSDAFKEMGGRAKVDEAISALMGGARVKGGTKDAAEKKGLYVKNDTVLDFAALRAGIGWADKTAWQVAAQLEFVAGDDAAQDEVFDYAFQKRNTLGSKKARDARKKALAEIGNIKDAESFRDAVKGIHAAEESGYKMNFKLLLLDDALFINNYYPLMISVLTNRSFMDYEKSGSAKERTDDSVAAERMGKAVAADKLDAATQRNAFRSLLTLRIDAENLPKSNADAYENRGRAPEDMMAKQMAGAILDWKLLDRALKLAAAHYVYGDNTRRTDALLAARKGQLGVTDDNAWKKKQDAEKIYADINGDAIKKMNKRLEAQKSKSVFEREKTFKERSDAAAQLQKVLASEKGARDEAAKKKTKYEPTSLAQFLVALVSMALDDLSQDSRSIIIAAKLTKMNPNDQARVIKLLADRRALDASSLTDESTQDNEAYEAARALSVSGKQTGEMTVTGEDINAALRTLITRRLDDKKFAMQRREGELNAAEAMDKTHLKAVYDWGLLDQAIRLTAMKDRFDQRVLLDLRRRKLPADASPNSMLKRFDSALADLNTQAAKQGGADFNYFLNFLKKNCALDMTQEMKRAGADIVIQQIAKYPPEDRVLLLRALGERGTLDLAKGNIHSVRAGMSDRRTHVNGKERNQFLDQYTDDGQKDADGKAMKENDLVPAAIRGLLTRQIHEEKALKKGGEPISDKDTDMLSTQEDDKLIDWKLLRRGMLLVMRARQEKQLLRDMELLGFAGEKLNDTDKKKIRAAMRAESETTGITTFQFIGRMFGSGETAPAYEEGKDSEKEEDPALKQIKDKLAEMITLQETQVLQAKSVTDTIKCIDAGKTITMKQAKELEAFIHGHLSKAGSGAEHEIPGGLLTLDEKNEGDELASGDALYKTVAEHLALYREETKAQTDVTDTYNTIISASSRSADLVLMLGTLCGNFAGGKHKDTLEKLLGFTNEAVALGQDISKIKTGDDGKRLGLEIASAAGGTLDLGIAVGNLISILQSGDAGAAAQAFKCFDRLANLVTQSLSIAEVGWRNFAEGTTDEGDKAYRLKMSSSMSTGAEIIKGLTALGAGLDGLRAKLSGGKYADAAKDFSAIAASISNIVTSSMAADRLRRNVDPISSDTLYNEQLIADSITGLGAEIASMAALLYDPEKKLDPQTVIALSYAPTLRALGHVSNIIGGALGTGQSKDERTAGAYWNGVGSVIISAPDMIAGIQSLVSSCGTNDAATIVKSIENLLKTGLQMAKVGIEKFSPKGAVGQNLAALDAVSNLVGLAGMITHQIIGYSSMSKADVAAATTDTAGKAALTTASILDTVNMFNSGAVDVRVIGGLKIAGSSAAMTSQMIKYFSASDEDKQTQKALLIAESKKSGTNIATEIAKLTNISANAPVAGLISFGVDTVANVGDMVETGLRLQRLKAACHGLQLRGSLNAASLREEMARLSKDDLDKEIAGIDASLSDEDKEKRKEEFTKKRDEKLTEQYIQTREAQRRQEHSEEGASGRTRHILHERQGHAVTDIISGAAKVIAEAFLTPMFAQFTNVGIDIAVRAGKAIVAHIQRNIWAKEEVKRFYRFPELEQKIPAPARKKMSDSEKEEFILTNILSFRSFRDCERAIRYYTASRLYANAVLYRPGAPLNDLTANALSLLHALGFDNVRSADPGRIAVAMA